MNATIRDPFAASGTETEKSFAEALSRSTVPTCLRTRVTATCANDRPAFSPRATWDSTRLSAIATYKTARPPLKLWSACNWTCAVIWLPSRATFGDLDWNLPLSNRLLDCR